MIYINVTQADIHAANARNHALYYAMKRELEGREIIRFACGISNELEISFKDGSFLYLWPSKSFIKKHIKDKLTPGKYGMRLNSELK